MYGTRVEQPAKCVMPVHSVEATQLKSTQVPESLDELQRTICVLEEKISALHKRLEPVLLMSSPNVVGPNEKMGPKVPLVEAINLSTEKVRGLFIWVEDIISRLQL